MVTHLNRQPKPPRLIGIPITTENPSRYEVHHSIPEKIFGLLDSVNFDTVSVFKLKTFWYRLRWHWIIHHLPFDNAKIIQQNQESRVSQMLSKKERLIRMIQDLHIKIYEQELARRAIVAKQFLVSR